MPSQWWSPASCPCVSLSWYTQSSSLKTKRCSKMLCTTKDLSRNGYDTACCTFQLIELMRTMDTHKKEKTMHWKAYQTKLLQWPTSFGHPGMEISRKTGKNTGRQPCSVEPPSFILLWSPAGRGAIHWLALPAPESSRQVSTDLGNFLQFPAPVLPVKPSILQCS